MTTSTLIANTNTDWMVNSKFKTVVTSGGRAYIEEKEFGYSGDLKINYNILFLKLGGYMNLFYCYSLPLYLLNYYLYFLKINFQIKQ